jgi:hypothetical protein
MKSIFEINRRSNVYLRSSFYFTILLYVLIRVLLYYVNTTKDEHIFVLMLPELALVTFLNVMVVGVILFTIFKMMFPTKLSYLFIVIAALPVLVVISAIVAWKVYHSAGIVNYILQRPELPTRYIASLHANGDEKEPPGMITFYERRAPLLYKKLNTQDVLKQDTNIAQNLFNGSYSVISSKQQDKEVVIKIADGGLYTIIRK